MNFGIVAIPPKVTRFVFKVGVVVTIFILSRTELFKYIFAKYFQSSHFITSKIEGRTGNQLFILFTLLAASRDASFTPFIHSDVNLLLEEYFEIRNIYRLHIDMSSFKHLPESAWTKYDGPIASQINSSYNWAIRGYRQSFKYFRHRRGLISESFIFKKEIQMEVTRHLIEMDLKGKTKVGIHVRRGDFLLENSQRNGYTVSSKYYIVKAMEYFKENLGKHIDFIFVSDDISWCMNNFKGTDIHFATFGNPGKDLYLLTQCDHNIITGGSFGWMGAWLNQTGLVIYDKGFPRPLRKVWWGFWKEDYYPSDWIGL